MSIKLHFPIECTRQRQHEGLRVIGSKKRNAPGTACRWSESTAWPSHPGSGYLTGWRRKPWQLPSCKQHRWVSRTFPIAMAAATKWQKVNGTNFAALSRFGFRESVLSIAGWWGSNTQDWCTHSIDKPGKPQKCQGSGIFECTVSPDTHQVRFSSQWKWDIKVNVMHS